MEYTISGQDGATSLSYVAFLCYSVGLIFHQETSSSASFSIVHEQSFFAFVLGNLVILIIVGNLVILIVGNLVILTIGNLHHLNLSFAIFITRVPLQFTSVVLLEMQ